MNTPVSVIIPTYRHGPLLAEAIESTLEQEYQPMEVIVINDGSPDDTHRLVQKYENRITYIEQENRGVTGARNAGIRKSNGLYIAFLDGDDLLTPKSISRRAAFLDTHAGTSMVCGDAEILGTDGTQSLYSSRSGKPRYPENFRWETIEFCALPSTTMVRREALEKVGMFDENIRKAGAEDWNLWVRMSLHFNMAYLDEPMARWRSQGQNTSNNIELLKINNRYAVSSIISSPDFPRYPSDFRARLLYFRFACAWNNEGKSTALHFLLRAFVTDPRQFSYGVGTVIRGLGNQLRRRRSKGQ